MRLLPLALAALLLQLTAAPAARAELERGEAAPPLGAAQFVQGAAADLSALRGCVVLLEFFRTTCPHCQAHVVQLNRLHERYATRGLVVLGVSRESAEVVRAFAARHGARYRLAVAGVDAQRAHLVRRYPEACLVDAFGDVAWAGYALHLPEDVLEAQLQRALPPPTLGAGLAWVPALLAAGRHGEVRRRLTPQKDCRADRDADCRSVREILAWVDAYAARGLGRAEEARVLGRPYDAWRALDEIARRYAGEAEGRRAQAGRTLLESATAEAREIAAGRALTAAVAAARHLSGAEAAARYREVAAQWPRTRAGAQAEAKADRLQTR